MGVFFRDRRSEKALKLVYSIIHRNFTINSSRYTRKKLTELQEEMTGENEAPGLKEVKAVCGM